VGPQGQRGQTGAPGSVDGHSALNITGTKEYKFITNATLAEPTHFLVWFIDRDDRPAHSKLAPGDPVGLVGNMTHHLIVVEYDGTSFTWIDLGLTSVMTGPVGPAGQPGLTTPPTDLGGSVGEFNKRWNEGYFNKLFVNTSVTTNIVDARTVNVGNTLTVQGFTSFQSTLDVPDNNFGAVSVDGGMSIAKTLQVAGTGLFTGLAVPQLEGQLNPALHVEGPTQFDDVAYTVGIIDVSAFPATQYGSGGITTDGGISAQLSSFFADISTTHIKTRLGTDATSTTTGDLQVAGGAGIVKNAFIGDALNVAGQATFASTTDWSGTGTGAVLIKGSLEVYKTLKADAAVAITGDTQLTSTTESTNSLTGAFTVAGGAGIDGNLFVGTLCNCNTFQTPGMAIAFTVSLGSDAYGNTIFWTPGGDNILHLPPPKEGVTIRIVIVDPDDPGSYSGFAGGHSLITADGPILFGMVSHADDGTVTSFSANSDVIVNKNTPSLVTMSKGDWFEFDSDGTSWYIRGMVAKAASIGAL
jgi:hypothetical protein